MCIHAVSSKSRRSARFGIKGVGALAVLALIPACGGSKDSGSGGSGSSTGGSVVYALEAETNGGWCLPESQLAISGIQVARAVYDTLTEPDENGEIKPFLAESVEPNATYDEWTLKVRPGVTFHDGSKLDATVVKNNIDAYRGTYPARKPQLFVFTLSNISDVSVVDDMTVKIKTKTPWKALPWFLFGSARMGIMGQAQLDAGSDCNTKLIGTGPFIFKEWKENERTVVEKNPHYWQKDSEGKQLPYLDKIEFRPVPDSNQRREGLEAGTYDLMHTNGGEQVSMLRDAKSGGAVEVFESDKFPETNYIMFNESKAPFNSLNARRAVAYAMDQKKINELRYSGSSPIASGPFGPGNMGYLKDAGQPGHDLAKAKEAAAAFEQETGSKLSFTMLGATDSAVQANLELYQSMLKEAGIDMTIATVDQASLIDKAIKGDFESTWWRNNPGGDPDINYVWWSENSPVNFGRIKDPELQRLLDEGRTSSDEAKRKTIYEDLNKRFADQTHNYWVVWTVWAIGHKPGVTGILGPNLPDGSKPFTSLATGHPVAALTPAK